MFIKRIAAKGLHNPPKSMLRIGADALKFRLEMSRKVQSENTQRMDVWMWKDFEAEWSVAK